MGGNGQQFHWNTTKAYRTGLVCVCAETDRTRDTRRQPGAPESQARVQRAGMGSTIAQRCEDYKHMLVFISFPPNESNMETVMSL